MKLSIGNSNKFRFLFRLFYLLIFLISGVSCEKWDLDKKPEVNTLEVTGISYTKANISVGYEVFQGEQVYEAGVCIDETGTPDLNDLVYKSNDIDGAYTVQVDNLLINTSYYCRAWVRTDFGVTYGNIQSFKTQEGGQFPVIETLQVKDITKSTAKITARILYEGLSPVNIRGFCWSSGHTPEIADDTINCGSGTGEYEVVLHSLLPNTGYEVRAFAINTEGVFFGNSISFTTFDGTASTPYVKTRPVTSITQTTAIGSGEVVSDSGFSVLSRGVCWSKLRNPTITDFYSQEGNGLGVFQAVIADLEPNINYYLRAYATNVAGTGYGEEITFTTQTLNGTIPVVITGNISNISLTGAFCDGIVTSQGSYPVLYRGICWSTHPNPTINDYRTFEGSGTGSFTSEMANLQEYTEYFVRAYASNSAGTAYGSEISFTSGGGTGFYLGQVYQGGTIAFIDNTGNHGLIVTSNDLAFGIPWGCDGILLPGAVGTAIGSGALNTTQILAGCTEPGIPAKLCADLVINGYDDWFLPSKDELSLLFQNRQYIGNMNTGFYWSSTQYNAYNAWQQNFVTGNQSSYGKFDPAIVRAVRTF